MVVVVALLSGCAASAAGIQAAAPPAVDVAGSPTVTGVIQPLAAYEPISPLPTPTATPEAAEEQVNVVINTQGLRANLRNGPGTNFAIVAKANPGDVFPLVGQNEGGTWFQLALPSSGNDEEEETAWISADLVRTAGEGEIPVVEASTEVLLMSGLNAQWTVDWTCNSERCQIRECSAEVNATVNREPANNFLPVEHTVTWADECFSTDAWTFEVNEYTGEERTGEAEENFLYSYWLGTEPGQANGVFPLDATTGVAVYCSGPHSVEIEEGGGWTTIYEGNTCHDVGTGLLVYMNYTKRWLYTGDYDGKTYNRAYFGDSEKLEQKLATVENVPLELLKKSK